MPRSRGPPALLDEAFAETPPDLVVVQGDTNTTLAGALAANARQIPLVHVEAGLRSYDRAMPEEHNRVVADHLADLCCAPTETSRAQLAAEGITGARVIVTGNTVVDAATAPAPGRDRTDKAARTHALERDGFVLSTFHRPENVDDEHGAAPSSSPSSLRSRSPCCSRSILAGAARARDAGLLDRSGAVRIVEPLGYRSSSGSPASARSSISDSGGVQEEASIVKRPVLVVRASTERPEVLGTFAEPRRARVRPSASEVGRWARDIDALHAAARDHTDSVR